MAHSAKRSQRRRLARIRAGLYVPPPLVTVATAPPSHQPETLNDRIARLADTSESRKSASRAMQAGRRALRRATTSTHVRDIDLRYLQLTGE